MIILDTNVVSEPLKPQPNPNVLEWLDCQAVGTLFLTTLTFAELNAGIEILPAGKRRTQLHHALTARVMPLFEGRVLSFEQAAATAFGRIYASAQAVGNPIDFADCAIAAIATSRRYIVATRNARDFKGTGTELINPWE